MTEDDSGLRFQAKPPSLPRAAQSVKCLYLLGLWGGHMSKSTCMSVYLYVERERERERHVCIYIYIYVYIKAANQKRWVCNILRRSFRKIGL